MKQKMQQLLKHPGIRAVGVVVWLLLGYVLANALAVGIFWAIVPSDISQAALNPVVLTTLLAAAIYVTSLILVVGGMWWARGWTVTSVRKRLGLAKAPHIKDAAFALMGYVPYLAFSIVLVTIIALLVPGFDVEQAQELGFESLTGNVEFILAFIALVVLAPVAEELLFRGYLFGTLRRLMSFIPATIVVSVLFGLVHGQWNVAIDTFMLSIVMCWLREYTGSIWAAIFLHMFKNGLAFALLFVV